MFSRHDCDAAGDPSTGSPFIDGTCWVIPQEHFAFIDPVAAGDSAAIANVDPAKIPDEVSGLTWAYSLCTHGVCVCDGEDAIVAAART